MRTLEGLFELTRQDPATSPSVLLPELNKETARTPSGTIYTQLNRVKNNS